MNITEDSLIRILDNKLKPLEYKIEDIVKSTEFIRAKYDESHHKSHQNLLKNFYMTIVIAHYE